MYENAVITMQFLDFLGIKSKRNRIRLLLFLWKEERPFKEGLLQVRQLCMKKSMSYIFVSSEVNLVLISNNTL